MLWCQITCQEKATYELTLSKDKDNNICKNKIYWQQMKRMHRDMYTIIMLLIIYTDKSIQSHGHFNTKQH